MDYQIRLQNLSLGGAMVSADEGIMAPVGDTCTLSLSHRDGEPPLVLTGQVVHSFYSMLGMKFIAFPDGAELALYQLLHRITSETETLRQEWEEVLGHGAAEVEVIPPFA